MVPSSTTPLLHRRADLLAAGWTDRRIRAAVESGALTRLRGGAFARADTADGCLAAGRVGGRLTCLSELARLGVFVLEEGPLHVHVPANAPRHRRIGRLVSLHWRELHRTPHPRSLSVDPFDALVQAVRCQTPRASVATIDSALRLGVLHRDDLDALFAALPRRYRMLRKLIDPRAESGPESLLRLLLRSLGCRFDVQVNVAGVGRVDFLVEGWLVIECDSRAHHSTWEAQREDRRRDRALAEQGYATLRVIGEDVMWNPAAVLAAVRGLLAGHRGERRDASRTVGVSVV